MRIVITIEGVSAEENGEKEKFELESDSFENFNEVAKCIMLSGWKIKAYKIFDGTD